MKKKGLAMFTSLLLAFIMLAGCGGNKQPEPAAPEPAAAEPAVVQEEAKVEEPVVVEEVAPHNEETQASGEDISIEDTTQDIEEIETLVLKDSPFLQGRGLPPVEERLPKVPKLTNELPEDQLTYEVGKYGGTLRLVTSAIDWDADCFVMNNEPLLNTPGILGREVTGNILAGYDVSADQKEFTFYMREGLRWSDGEYVTVEDVRFVVEDLLFNEDYTQSFPAWLRSGGERDGDPMQFQVVNDYEFKITFTKPYGGFPIRLAITGWVGYTELMHPSHYLKQFHPKYATDEEMAKWDGYCDEFGIARNDDLTWINVLNHFRQNNWDINQRRKIGYPGLYPWLLVSATETVWTWERNPYYFKIDEDGNQLPYIDKIESTVVADMEMVQLKMLAGEVDFARESSSLVNMPLYKENEKNGFTTLMCNMHVTPTDIGVNMTFSDDDGYKAMVQDVRFRKALSLAIDRDELIDSIYYGYAEPNTWQDSTYDPDAAMALLEEMGMEKGSDGFYKQPDGKAFTLIIENGAEAPDIVPYCELITEFWRDIGINASSRRIDQALVGNKQAANELQCRVIWTHTPLWTAQDWGIFMWGRAWEIWKNNTTEVELKDEQGNYSMQSVSGEEPPQAVKDFYNMIDSLMQVSVADASTTVYSNLKQSLNENFWYFVPIINVKQPMLVNSKLRNTSDKGFAIGVNFSGEQFWFEQ